MISSGRPYRPARHLVWILLPTLRLNEKAFGTNAHAPFLSLKNRWPPSPAQISHLLLCWGLNLNASLDDFDRFEIVNQLNLLVKDLVRVVTVEDSTLCKIV